MIPPTCNLQGDPNPALHFSMLCICLYSLQAEITRFFVAQKLLD